MTKQEKLLEKIRNNPSSVSFEKLVNLLESFGFEVKNYSGGSHYSVSHPDDNIIGTMEPNSIPMHKPTVLPVYVRRAIVWIDRVRQVEETNSADSKETDKHEYE
ncbi:MAG: type II toxin-antitoxin system HicA family toxin [Coriobacteriales bacterium]|nr:type II toxin-antitoxin system HicA family toxin [Coriobacteriales bacterium]